MALFGLFNKKKKNEFPELERAIKGDDAKINSDLGLPIRKEGDFGVIQNTLFQNDDSIKIDTINAKIDNINQRLINIERLLIKIYEEKNKE